MSELNSVPTVEDVLSDTAIGNGWHDFAVEGGTIRVCTEDLQRVLEENYDSTMPDWPALILEDDLCAAMDA